MKKYLYVVMGLMICCTQIFSQNAFQVQNVNTGYAVNGNDVVLPTYHPDEDVQGNPYFSKDWIKGSVKTTDNQEYSIGLLFMYDKTTGKLYFKYADSSTIREADLEKISSFILITDKPHTFMRGDAFSASETGKFLEVLSYNEKKYSLLKYTTTTYEVPQTSKAAQSMMQSISYGKFVDNVTYYLAYNHGVYPVELKRKTFSDGFKLSDRGFVEDYISKNKGKFNENFAARLIDDINESIL